MIPLIGFKSIPETIRSISIQKHEKLEILILRNNITTLPEGNEVMEFRINFFIRELLIREKGNALNQGIKYALGELIIVLDADCVLQKDALKTAIKHFEDKEVIAVGGLLQVQKEDDSFIEIIQTFEYMRTFIISRRVFNYLNGQCLISGAFGVFRKETLIDIGGYDTDTVGEDMELVLRIQKSFPKSNKRIVYETKAICMTKVPHNFKRLLHQRDRWQRGLLDSLIKHRTMILNPSYGFLGIVVLTYQLFFELLGPIFSLLYLTIFWYQDTFPKIAYFGISYLIVEFIISLIATYMESNKKLKVVFKRIPYLIVMTIIFSLYQLVITSSRINGIITFKKRRLEW